MNVLLIDSRTKNINLIINSLLDSTDYVIFDFETDDVEKIIGKISSKKYFRAGIFQEENYKYYQLTRLFTQGILTDVMNDDSELNSWEDFIRLLTNLKSQCGISNLDLLACNLGLDTNWKYVETKLESLTGIQINSSLGLTGKDGNWTLENGKVNLVGTYFTDGIYKYEFNLGLSDPNNSGGIFGPYSSGIATDCYTAGNTITVSGGIYGSNCTGTATNCYSNGSLSGSASEITINNCYEYNLWNDTDANSKLSIGNSQWNDISFLNNMPFLLSFYLEN